MKVKGQIVKYVYGAWTEHEATLLNITIGMASGQTTWEYLALYISLSLFAAAHIGTGIVLLGDNFSSLSLALHVKGQRGLGIISREISWRRIRQGWRYACGHLPSEQNEVADALSRQNCPDKKALPPDLASATLVSAPSVAALWTDGL